MAKQPNWTPQEDECLRRCHGLVQPTVLAETLHRSLRALGVRASKLGVRSQRYGYTILDLTKELGLCQPTVQRLVAEGVIQSQRRFTYEPTQRPKWLSISDEQVRTFIRTHFLLYNPESVADKWKPAIPFDLLSQWLPLSVASAKYHYSYQWFYDLVWHGFVHAEKGRQTQDGASGWELWVYEPDIKKVLDDTMTPHFAKSTRRPRGASYKKGKLRGWQVLPNNMGY